jgi:hypothetical protein
VPTVLREGPYRFFFVSCDHAEPPHVHVMQEKKVAKFWLDPVALQKAGGFSPTELNRIAGIIIANQEHLWYPRLWYGTPEERNKLEIIGDGTLIHWPDLDEDLSVSGVLAGRRSGESQQSLKKWLAQRATSGEQTRYRRARQSSVPVRDKSSVPTTVQPNRKMRK